MKVIDRLRRKAVRRFDGRPVPIVADAAISTGAIGDGRLIPLVILDTTERPDLEELIRVHQHVRPGDVTSQWSTIKDGTGNIGLLLKFEKPMEISVLLVFDIIKQSVVVDQIVRVKGLYIQAGREGDRFIHDTAKPKVLMEIPDTGFRQIWEGIFYESIVKRMREGGLPRHEAKRAARRYLDEWRKFGEFRIPQR